VLGEEERKSDVKEGRRNSRNRGRSNLDIYPFYANLLIFSGGTSKNSLWHDRGCRVECSLIHGKLTVVRDSVGANPFSGASARKRAS
jgi:hypothetical protein